MIQWVVWLFERAKSVYFSFFQGAKYTIKGIIRAALFTRKCLKSMSWQKRGEKRMRISFYSSLMTPITRATL